MENITVDVNELIKKAQEEKCEITVSFSPERTEITIQPWKLFTYTCPAAIKEATKNGKVD